VEVGPANFVVLPGHLVPRQGLLVVLEGFGPVALLRIDNAYLVVGYTDLVVLLGLLYPHEGLPVAFEGLGPVALLGIGLSDDTECSAHTVLCIRRRFRFRERASRRRRARA
jgi:hypothetical protein